MSEKIIKKVMVKKKVGSYTLKLMSSIPEGRYWAERRYPEVRKGNKILFNGTEKSSGSFYEAEKQYKDLIEEYKKKAIEDGNYKFVASDFVKKPKDLRGYEMVRVNKYTGEEEEVKGITTFEGFVRAFIHNQIGNKKVVGHYRIEDNKLIYQETREKKETLVMNLKNGLFLGNASKLKYCGWNLKGDEAPAQRVMFNMNIPLVPFNVFEEAKLNIQKCKVLEQGKEEDFILPKLEWDEHEKTLKPVEVFLNDESIKEPQTNKDIKIISKKFIKNLIYKKNKDGDYKINRDGNYAKFDGWEYKYLDKRRLAKRHFVGAMLLKVGKKYFLFDVDRNELKHYRFNPFLSELPKPCKTIKEAYEILKPDEVKRAEKKGLKVLRQGEWFFIPTKKKISEKKPKLPISIKDGLNKKPELKSFDLDYSYSYCSDGDIFSMKDNKDILLRIKKKYKNSIILRIKDYNKEVKIYQSWEKKKEDFEKKFNFFDWGGELKAGQNRPNRVKKLCIINGVNYCSGEVSHTGREHEPIELKGWYIAIPNTATKSFTISGNID